MIITSIRHLTHLVSQNKCVRFWHQQLAHISIVLVLIGAKLVNKIKLDDNKEYNLVEVLIDSDNSNVSELPNNKKSHTRSKFTIIAHQSIATKNLDFLDKLYTSCMRKKPICVIRQNKSIIAITKKLENVHMNLWSPHNPFFQSRNIYIAILIWEHTCKT